MTEPTYLKKIKLRHRVPPSEWSEEGKKNRVRDLIYDTVGDMCDSFKYDNNAIWDITHAGIALETCEILKFNGVLRNSIVTDANAGVGGLTLVLANWFNTVNAIEVNSERVKILHDNMKTFKLTNVNVQQGYYQDMEFQQDVVFFDPPWGGVDYREQLSVRVCVDGPFGSVPIEDIICVENTKFVVVKLPFNYDRAMLQKISTKYTVISNREYPRPNTCIILILEKINN